MKHRWSHAYMYTCVLAQRKDSPLSNLSYSSRWRKTLWQMSQKALTFCPNAVGSAAFQQQQQLRLPVYLMCNLRRWTCYFPSLLLNMRRAAGAWSYFWGSLPRLAHPWLDEGMPQSTADPFRGAVSQPQLIQQSAMLVCTWRKAPYGVWMASQHSPSCPGVEPKSQAGGGAFCRGGEYARETALPRLCSLGQDPQLLAPLCLF